MGIFDWFKGTVKGDGEAVSLGEEWGRRVTKESRRAAIEGAQTVAELDAMWAAWERSGVSRDGLLYAELLQRKQALGAALPQGEINRIHAADAAWKHGKSLPTIHGRGR